MKGNVFQTAMLMGFVGLLMLGFISFALYKASDSDVESYGRVVIWGTFESTKMNAVIRAAKGILPENTSSSITYRQIDERNFNSELVEALAIGEGPDMFLLHHGDIIDQKNKIFTIPFDSYSERRFKETYVEGAEIFKKHDGIIALPFMIDPLVMYWNRDILNREGVAVAPKYWDEFFALSPRLTKRDSTANILLSTIAFGEYKNITNAKEILSALFLQSNSTISEFVKGGDDLKITLSSSGVFEEDALSPVSALRFYTEFSNPIKSVYSWNRSLNESRRAFLSGDLVFYFGFASELEDISKSNPNLNFDIAEFPQIRDSNKPITYGNMYGLAMSKSAKNLSGGFKAAVLLSSDAVLQVLSEETKLPPIKRTLLSNTPKDDIQPVLYRSALIARGWLEPSREEADLIFQDMIESITSGRLRISSALSEASDQLNGIK